MPCSRRRRHVSQKEDFNIFKLVFRWEVHNAHSHQGLPGAGDLLPSCRHGDHQRTSYSCKGTHSGDCCCSYSLSRQRKASGCHSVEEILRALRNVACCFDPHQGIWQSLNWITCFTTTCSLMPWWRVRWAPILWTPSFSTLWNSLMVSIISMARKEISCSWHAMGDSLHLPSESWLQYCNHLSKKNHAAAFQQFQQLLRNNLNQSHINRFTFQQSMSNKAKQWPE